MGRQLVKTKQDADFKLPLLSPKRPLGAKYAHSWLPDDVDAFLGACMHQGIYTPEACGLRVKA